MDVDDTKLLEPVGIGCSDVGVTETVWRGRRGG